ncbi:recombination protein NinG, partial [Pseudomonas aeruginosa]
MMLSTRQPKPRTCENPTCKATFTPHPMRLGQKVCSPACALSIKDKHAKPARKAIADRERREIKVRKERLKTHSDHIKDAEKAVRDYRRTYELSIGSGCISCGKSQAEVLAEQGWKT